MNQNQQKNCILCLSDASYLRFYDLIPLCKHVIKPLNLNVLLRWKYMSMCWLLHSFQGRRWKGTKYTLCFSTQNSLWTHYFSVQPIWPIVCDAGSHNAYSLLWLYLSLKFPFFITTCTLSSSPSSSSSSISTSPSHLTPQELTVSSCASCSFSFLLRFSLLVLLSLLAHLLFLCLIYTEFSWAMRAGEKRLLSLAECWGGTWIYVMSWHWLLLKHSNQWTQEKLVCCHISQCMWI